VKQHVITYLPYLLSAITIWMTLLAGNKHHGAWLVGLVGQALWLVWIVATAAWGLLPLNGALWIVYARNHWKWGADEANAAKVTATINAARAEASKDGAQWKREIGRAGRRRSKPLYIHMSHPVGSSVCPRKHWMRIHALALST
jgi:hypothetical protein